MQYVWLYFSLCLLQKWEYKEGAVIREETYSSSGMVTSSEISTKQQLSMLNDSNPDELRVTDEESSAQISNYSVIIEPRDLINFENSEEYQETKKTKRCKVDKNSKLRRKDYPNLHDAVTFRYYKPNKTLPSVINEKLKIMRVNNNIGKTADNVVYVPEFNDLLKDLVSKNTDNFQLITDKDSGIRHENNFKVPVPVVKSLLQQLLESPLFSMLSKNDTSVNIQHPLLEGSKNLTFRNALKYPVITTTETPFYYVTKMFTIMNNGIPTTQPIGKLLPVYLQEDSDRYKNSGNLSKLSENSTGLLVQNNRPLQTDNYYQQFFPDARSLKFNTNTSLNADSMFDSKLLGYKNTERNYLTPVSNNNYTHSMLIAGREFVTKIPKFPKNDKKNVTHQYSSLVVNNASSDNQMRSDRNSSGIKTALKDVQVSNSLTNSMKQLLKLVNMQQTRENTTKISIAQNNSNVEKLKIMQEISKYLKSINKETLVSNEFIKNLNSEYDSHDVRTQSDIARIFRFVNNGQNYGMDNLELLNEKPIWKTNSLHGKQTLGLKTNKWDNIRSLSSDANGRDNFRHSKTQDKTLEINDKNKTYTSIQLNNPEINIPVLNNNENIIDSSISIGSSNRYDEFSQNTKFDNIMTQDDMESIQQELVNHQYLKDTKSQLEKLYMEEHTISITPNQNYNKSKYSFLGSLEEVELQPGTWNDRTSSSGETLESKEANVKSPNFEYVSWERDPRLVGDYLPFSSGAQQGTKLPIYLLNEHEVLARKHPFYNQWYQIMKERMSMKHAFASNRLRPNGSFIHFPNPKESISIISKPSQNVPYIAQLKNDINGLHPSDKFLQRDFALHNPLINENLLDNHMIFTKHENISNEKQEADSKYFHEISDNEPYKIKLPAYIGIAEGISTPTSMPVKNQLHSSHSNNNSVAPNCECDCSKCKEKNTSLSPINCLSNITMINNNYDNNENILPTMKHTDNFKFYTIREKTEINEILTNMSMSTTSKPQSDIQKSIISTNLNSNQIMIFGITNEDNNFKKLSELNSNKLNTTEKNKVPSTYNMINMQRAEVRRNIELENTQNSTTQRQFEKLKDKILILQTKLVPTTVWINEDQINTTKENFDMVRTVSYDELTDNAITFKQEYNETDFRSIFPMFEEGHSNVNLTETNSRAEELFNENNLIKESNVDPNMDSQLLPIKTRKDPTLVMPNESLFRSDEVKEASTIEEEIAQFTGIGNKIPCSQIKENSNLSDKRLIRDGRRNKSQNFAINSLEGNSMKPTTTNYFEMQDIILNYNSEHNTKQIIPINVTGTLQSHPENIASENVEKRTVPFQEEYSTFEIFKNDISTEQTNYESHNEISRRLTTAGMDSFSLILQTTTLNKNDEMTENSNINYEELELQNYITKSLEYEQKLKDIFNLSPQYSNDDTVITNDRTGFSDRPGMELLGQIQNFYKSTAKTFKLRKLSNADTSFRSLPVQSESSEFRGTTELNTYQQLGGNITKGDDPRVQNSDSDQSNYKFILQKEPSCGHTGITCSSENEFQIDILHFTTQSQFQKEVTSNANYVPEESKQFTNTDQIETPLSTGVEFTTDIPPVKIAPSEKYLHEIPQSTGIPDMSLHEIPTITFQYNADNIQLLNEKLITEYQSQINYYTIPTERSDHTITNQMSNIRNSNLTAQAETLEVDWVNDENEVKRIYFAFPQEVSLKGNDTGKEHRSNISKRLIKEDYLLPMTNKLFALNTGTSNNIYNPFATVPVTEETDVLHNFLSTPEQKMVLNISQSMYSYPSHLETHLTTSEIKASKTNGNNNNNNNNPHLLKYKKPQYNDLVKTSTSTDKESKPEFQNNILTEDNALKITSEDSRSFERKDKQDEYRYNSLIYQTTSSSFTELPNIGSNRPSDCQESNCENSMKDSQSGAYHNSYAPLEENTSNIKTFSSSGMSMKTYLSSESYQKEPNTSIFIPESLSFSTVYNHTRITNTYRNPTPKSSILFPPDSTILVTSLNDATVSSLGHEVSGDFMNILEHHEIRHQGSKHEITTNFNDTDISFNYMKSGNNEFMDESYENEIIHNNDYLSFIKQPSPSINKRDNKQPDNNSLDNQTISKERFIELVPKVNKNQRITLNEKERKSDGFLARPEDIEYLPAKMQYEADQVLNDVTIKNTDTNIGASTSPNKVYLEDELNYINLKQLFNYENLEETLKTIFNVQTIDDATKLKQTKKNQSCKTVGGNGNCKTNNLQDMTMFILHNKDQIKSLLDSLPKNTIEPSVTYNNSEMDLAKNNKKLFIFDSALPEPFMRTANIIEEDSSGETEKGVNNSDHDSIIPELYTKAFLSRKARYSDEMPSISNTDEVQHSDKEILYDSKKLPEVIREELTEVEDMLLTTSKSSDTTNQRTVRSTHLPPQEPCKNYCLQASQSIQSPTLSQENGKSIQTVSSQEENVKLIEIPQQLFLQLINEHSDLNVGNGISSEEMLKSSSHGINYFPFVTNVSHITKINNDNKNAKNLLDQGTGAKNNFKGRNKSIKPYKEENKVDEEGLKSHRQDVKISDHFSNEVMTNDNLHNAKAGKILNKAFYGKPSRPISGRNYSYINEKRKPTTLNNREKIKQLTQGKVLQSSNSEDYKKQRLRTNTLQQMLDKNNTSSQGINEASNYTKFRNNLVFKKNSDTIINTSKFSIYSDQYHDSLLETTGSDIIEQKFSETNEVLDSKYKCIDALSPVERRIPKNITKRKTIQEKRQENGNKNNCKDEEPIYPLKKNNNEELGDSQEDYSNQEFDSNEYAESNYSSNINDNEILYDSLIRKIRNSNLKDKLLHEKNQSNMYPYKSCQSHGCKGMLTAEIRILRSLLSWLKRMI